MRRSVRDWVVVYLVTLAVMVGALLAVGKTTDARRHEIAPASAPVSAP